MDSELNTSPAGRAFIEEDEGVVLRAYHDVVGVLTIGYGHTGTDVHEGMVWTQQQADQALEHDLAVAERCVNTHVHVPLTQDQFDALISLTFNIGVGAFVHSTLLMLLNRRDYPGAANQFLQWDRAKGQIVPGLLRRRTAERTLFLRPGKETWISP